MAYHKKHHARHRRHHNPFGVSGGIVKDALYVAGGAVLSPIAATKILPSMAAGWSGVATTAVAAVGLSFLAKMIGGPSAQEETLKGGLAAAVLKAMNAAGITAASFGLGFYGPGYFSIPSHSDQALRAYFGNADQAYQPVLPAATTGTGARLSGGRYRSRYTG